MVGSRRSVWAGSVMADSRIFVTISQICDCSLSLLGLPSYSTGLILGARGCFNLFCFLFCIPRQQDAENSRLRGKSILSLLPEYLIRAGCGFRGQRLLVQVMKNLYRVKL